MLETIYYDIVDLMLVHLVRERHSYLFEKVGFSKVESLNLIIGLHFL